MRHRLRQQCAPHVDPRELVLHFRLREEALRIGHFDDARQSRLVASGGLRLALLGRGELYGRVYGNRRVAWTMAAAACC